MNDKKLTLELTVNDINIIMAGLGKLPLEVSVDLWAKIKTQAEAQFQAEQAAGLSD